MNLELLKEGYRINQLDFHEMFVETINQPRDKLIETFNTEYISDTIVCYLKLVTAAFLKQNRETFEAFILDLYPTLDDFISSQVEPSE